MKINKFILAGLFLSLTLISAQTTEWRGMSVATSDNLDAMSLNPAGLGVSRGSMYGILVTETEDSGRKYRFTSRGNGAGISIYNNDETRYRLGLGANLGDNLYMGYGWDSGKQHTFGILSRPFPFISFGYTMNYDQNTEITGSRLGVAFRPLGYRWTVGVDMVTPDWSGISDFDQIEGASDFMAFAEFQPVDGLYFSASSSTNGNLIFHLGLDFGTGAVFSSQTQTDDITVTGFGLISHTQVQETIIRKKPDTPHIYYRMTMNDHMIEEKPFNPPFNFNLFGGKVVGTQLREWLEQIHRLTDDPAVAGIIIDLHNLSAGFGKYQEMREALQAFKSAGKKIIVYARNMGNMEYYLLSLADEIYMPGLSGVDLRGLVIEISFFKGLMDTLDIVAEVEQISPYKTAMDVFLRKDMSPEMRENYGMVFDDIYNQFVEGISTGRNWSVEKTISLIDAGPYSSEDAITAGLITGLKYPDDFDDYVDSLKDDGMQIRDFEDLGKTENYVHEWNETTKPKIAVIYAVGGIRTGKSVPGAAGSSVMGDETIREAIVSARKDPGVKAIVLRIDSGGGSALASDMMWKEILNTTELDSGNTKPFIASMSDVAASGGYYIACQADTIVADPGTITGSIGVISGRLNFSGFFEKVGITTDRLKFGEHSDIWSGRKKWSEEERAIIRKGILDVYGTFLSRVAHGREDLDSLQVDSVGVGKIWSGNQAKERKLIDEIGGLFRAIEIAKASAGLEGQDVEIVEYPNFIQRFRLFDDKLKRNQLRDILPEELSEELETLEILSGLENEPYLFLHPYRIKVY